MTIVLIPIVDDTITFAEMANDVSAFLQGCPSLVIERTMRKLIIDFCQRTKSWVADLSPAAYTAGVYELPLTPATPNAETADILEAYIILADGTKVPLRYAMYAFIRSAYPMWPENAVGQPEYVTNTNTGYSQLVPVPDVAGTLYIRAALRPIATAASWSRRMYTEFNRAIFHGTLHELLMMPERSWTDAKTAMYHGKQWTYLLGAARLRGETGFNAGSLAASMRPFA